VTDDDIVFNGLDGLTGGYLLTADAERIAELATGEQVRDAHLLDVNARVNSAQPSFGVVATVDDPSDLAQTGWGVIFADDADAAIREALRPLLDLRREQATRKDEKYYQEYSGPRGYHRAKGAAEPGETAQQFLAHRGVATSGAADPDQMPYYLLLVGDPETIPYAFQYQLDVQYAVGRIYFDTVEEYAHYARSVVLAERRNPRPRRAVFFGVQNEDDRATRLSTEQLVAPLTKDAEGWLADVPAGQPAWEIRTHLREQATKQQLARLLGGGEAPALLFTASHGAGFPNGHLLQERHQGALVCAEWPGPNNWAAKPLESCYLSADDVASDGTLLGMLAFHFACYGVGTPGLDDYPQLVNGAVKPTGPLGTSLSARIAQRSFVARLPRRLLGHPRGGALAVVGHVERALGSSFAALPGQPIVSPTTFRGALRRIMLGKRLGSAIEPFNERYAELCTNLAEEVRQIHSYGKVPQPLELARMWMGSADARGYAIFGDPAVRLTPDVAPAPGDETFALDPVVVRPSQPPPSAPPVPPTPPSRGDDSSAAPFVTDGGATPAPDASSPTPPAGQTSTAGPTTSAPPATPTQPTQPPAPAQAADVALRLQLNAQLRVLSGQLQRFADDLVSPAAPATFDAAGAEYEAFGVPGLDALGDKLRETMQQLGELLSQLVRDIAVLEVRTYVSDQIASVGPGDDAFAGAQQRAVSRIALDGDTQIVIPVDADAVDEAVWQIHARTVEQAQANRAAMLKAIGELLGGLLKPGG
jgi:hypothetical protein